jgi:LysM repeat protein
MRNVFGNSCARGCVIYLVALIAIVVVTASGMSGLAARFGMSPVQGNRPEVSALSVSVSSSPGDAAIPPPAPPADVAAGGGGGGTLATPTTAPPPPVPQPQPQPQVTQAPAPTAQAQGGTISGEVSAPFYIVQSGDTLWEIASKFGVNIDDLRAINNIQDNLIVPGQVLYLPQPGTSPAPPAAPAAPGPPSTGIGSGDSQEPLIPTMPHTGIIRKR